MSNGKFKPKFMIVQQWQFKGAKYRLEIKTNDESQSVELVNKLLEITFEETEIVYYKNVEPMIWTIIKTWKTGKSTSK